MSLAEALARLAEEAVLVASDFDGTLAPIVADPNDAQADPRALAAFAALTESSAVACAVVSGRRRDDLLKRVGNLAEVRIIGEHGSDSGEELPPGSLLIDELTRELRAIAAQHPGTAVEQKKFSVAFHYRNAAGRVDGALAEVRRGPGAHPEVVMSEGKKIIEIHETGRDKGDAVEAMRVSTGATAVVFIGDDVTDESVFRRLRGADVGIKVGDGPTAAGYRIADVEEVGDVLELLGDLLG